MARRILFFAPAVALAAACGLTFEDASTTPEGDGGIDATSVDAGGNDSGPTDSGRADSGPVATDGGDGGAALPDSGPTDSGPTDSGPTDSGACTAPTATNALLLDNAAPFTFAASYKAGLAATFGTNLGGCLVEGRDLLFVKDAGTATATIQRAPIVATCDGKHIGGFGAPVLEATAPGADGGFLRRAGALTYVGTAALLSTAKMGLFTCAAGACTKAQDLNRDQKTDLSVGLFTLGAIDRGVTSAGVQVIFEDPPKLTAKGAAIVSAPPQAAQVPDNSPSFGVSYAIAPGASNLRFYAFDADGSLTSPGAFASLAPPSRGLCMDKATGDLVVTTFDGTGRVFTIQGFAPAP